NVDLTFPDASFATQVATLQSMGLLHFMAPISASLPPNGSLADVPFELVPAGVAAELKKATMFSSTVVQATFTIAGDLAGGNVSSQEFHYSVTLGNQNLRIDNGLCSTVPTSFKPRPGNPCYPGQDFIVDCCGVTPTELKCPAVGTKM